MSEEILLKLQTSGRLTIPHGILEEEGIKVGDIIQVRIQKVKITPFTEPEINI